MSLQIAAQNLASKGRHGDTMLVHMTPQEVGGLQALAMAKGGSLTINPDTGLPEANFLKNLLPTILGIGASFLFPAAAPWMIGAGIGGIETLRTGDLGKGLMAGLGAFGGAGLGSALTAQGAQAMGHAAGLEAVGGADVFKAGLSPEAASQYANAFQGAQPSTFMGNVQAAGKGIANITEPGFMANLGQAFPSTTAKFAAATPAATELSNQFSPKFELPKTSTEKSNYEGPYVPSERSVQFPGEKSSTSEFAYFSPSNPVPGYVPKYIAAGGEIPYAGDNEDNQYAIGGLTALAGGRFLQGPGDGTSDSIPAVIGNKQPARLADGEFVVDARTVSELGNGSSKAGAQKLYKMMDRIHGARKKAGRGQDSKAEKYLPA